MLITLSELKNYLRIDSDDDDGMLENMLLSSEKTCADILRLDDVSMLEEQANVKIAVLYGASYLYEHREEADHNKLNLTIRALLSADRGEAF